MSDDTLKPCPFCGNEYIFFPAMFSYPDSDWRMVCDTCKHWTQDQAEAIAAWNHRPIEDELRARVKELEEQVFALSTGTRDSRMAQRIAALEQDKDKLAQELIKANFRVLDLEQWQRDAVEVLAKWIYNSTDWSEIFEDGVAAYIVPWEKLLDEDQQQYRDAARKELGK